MSSELDFSEDFNKIISYSEKLSYSAKAANNFRWAKRRAQAVDILNPDVFSEDYKKRVEDSYRLMSGLSMKHYTSAAADIAMVDAIDLAKEGLDMPNLELEHFDFLTPFINGLVGDQQKRKLQFVVTDSSLYTQNYIKEEARTALAGHYDTKLIQPNKQFALMQWQAENGVTDIFTLDDQQRQQMDADVNARMEALIPKDILRFLQKGAQGNLEKQGQAIAEFLVDRLKLKYLLDEAYRHSFANDGIVFYSGIKRNKTYVRWVDLTTFNTGGTNNLFIDNNPWFKEVTYEHPVAVWNNYSDGFNKEDRRKFNELVSRNGTKTNQEFKDEKFVTKIDFAGEVALGQTNLLTKEGQEQYSQLLQKYQGGDWSSFEMLRVAHITWSSQRLMKKILRGYKDGSLRHEYFGEDYEFNPQNGDLKEEKRWVQQYWKATQIGNLSDPLFADVGPVECQYRDITDPYETRSPYSGGYLNDLMGKGYRMSDIDRVKPIIHAVNFQMKTIKDREATDIGKVVLMTVAAKPKGWSWGKLISVVRATKFLPINTQQAGLTAADVQFFRDIDLSNMYDILPRINYLQFLISRIGAGLSVNEARSGQVAASTSVSNNLSALNRSFSQTHSRARWADEIMERLMENLIYLGRKSAKNGNIFIRRVLDDLSRDSIDIDVDEFDQAYFGVRVVADEKNLQELDIAKNYLLPMLQNRGIGYRLAAETISAMTRGELLEISEKAELEEEIRQASMADIQAQVQADQRKWEEDIIKLKGEIERLQAAEANEAKKEMAALSSMTIAHGADINQNLENDYLESAREQIAFKDRELVKRDEWEKGKIAVASQSKATPPPKS